MYSVVMRDSSESYSFTLEEYAVAKQRSGFEPRDEQTTEHANFMFAAMAKRFQIENGISSYSMAIQELNGGQNWKTTPHYLGVQQYVIRGPDPKFLPHWIDWRLRKFLKRHKAGIAKSRWHTWFATNGLQDIYGKSTTFSWTLNGLLLTGAIALDTEAISRLQ